MAAVMKEKSITVRESNGNYKGFVAGVFSGITKLSSEKTFITQTIPRY